VTFCFAEHFLALNNLSTAKDFRSGRVSAYAEDWPDLRSPNAIMRRSKAIQPDRTRNGSLRCQKFYKCKFKSFETVPEYSASLLRIVTNRMSESARPPTSNLPAYFNQLSVTYPTSTGRSTEGLFAQLLPRIAPITSESIIHDNASGPATATSVLLADTGISSARPRIICTDMVSAMIDAVNGLAKEKQWTNVEGKIMKSDEAMNFPDDYFTHSLTNFSIFNFSNRAQAMSEIHRNLKPGGQVIVTTWKTFAPGDITHEVQRRIRPDSPLMRLSGPDMYDGNAVMDVLVKGGFEQEKLEIVEGSYVAKDDNLLGLLRFLKSDFTKSARESWTEEEKENWNVVADQVVEEQCKLHGGILFEMYAIIGRK
jgi:SAM-dependent methyltransferase